MIRHIVFIRFKPEMTDAMIAALFDELYAIKDKLSGVLSITSGKSESPEQMERGYMHGFIVDFADWDALLVYQDHPDHKILGGKLVANAVAGIDDILVFDLPVKD
jgi:hypothetical protein